MRNICTVMIFLVPFYYSCKQQGNGTSNEQENKNDTTKFFQVSQYIQSQIKAVNNTPYYIYKLDITNSKKDSASINNDVFDSLSSQFYKPDINDPGLKKYYTENTFYDQTTKNYTISYTTTNKYLEIQSVEILFKEDGQTVNRIFIRKFFNYTDSSAIEQLSWKPGESFQINRAVQKADNSENSHQTKVVWDEKS